MLSLRHCSAPRSIGPEFPLKGFADLDAARQWAAVFVHWYNQEHRHSGIRYVTPAQRHAGQDTRVLTARHAVYQDARDRNPQRWSGPTRNWTAVGAVTLNPERNAIVRAATSQIQLSGSIGEPAFPFFNRIPFCKAKHAFCSACTPAFRPGPHHDQAPRGDWVKTGRRPPRSGAQRS